MFREELQRKEIGLKRASLYAAVAAMMLIVLLVPFSSAQASFQNEPSGVANSSVENEPDGAASSSVENEPDGAASSSVENEPDGTATSSVENEPDGSASADFMDEPEGSSSFGSDGLYVADMLSFYKAYWAGKSVNLRFFLLSFYEL
jgi:hypothetical protein